MADSEQVKPKNRLSAVFRRKSKDIKQDLEDEELALENVDSGEAKSEEKEDIECVDVDGSHDRVKKKSGSRRYLPRLSRKKKSKKQLTDGEKNEDQSCNIGEEDASKDEGADTINDENKTDYWNEENEEFDEEKGNKEEEEKSTEMSKEQKCESPEAMVQTEDETNTKEQTKEEKGENSNEGSVIRSLLQQGKYCPTSTDEHDKHPSNSVRNEGNSQKSYSEEVGKFIPNVMIANFLNMMFGSKSNDTGSPQHTKTEFVYKLVLQTADQTYSTLVKLVSLFLARAGQVPRQVLVNVLVYLIQKYPQCFKIKKMKRKRKAADLTEEPDTVKS